MSDISFDGKDEKRLPWSNNWMVREEEKVVVEPGKYYWIRPKLGKVWRICYLSLDPDEKVFVTILGAKEPIPLEQMKMESFDIQSIAHPSEALLQAIGVEQQPEPNGLYEKYVWDLVITDMKARNEMGEKKYGTKLRPFDGRNSLKDAYHEVLDLAVYLRKKIFEEVGK